MMNQNIFEYESDWVNYFESILRNEIRDDINNQNKIKANIVESNQSVQSFVKRNKNIKYFPSKEKFFHNLEGYIDNTKYYFYIDDSNPRFWLVHNVENKKKISNFIKDITSNSYLQDNIYLSHRTLDKYQKNFGASSLGFTLNFEQLFTTGSNNAFLDSVENFEDIGFTLQLWPKRKKSISFFLDKLKEINCPINYKSLNFVFEEDDDVLVKEDLYYDGSITINRGSKFRKHLNFLENIKQDYNNMMELIEESRIDWERLKGGLFYIDFNHKIDPKNFVSILNQKSFGNIKDPFKIIAFFMYKEENFYMYNCIDTHTGGKFYMQVFRDKLIINLDKHSCGNIIFRLFTNLQRFFSIDIKLYTKDAQIDI